MAAFVAQELPKDAEERRKAGEFVRGVSVSRDIVGAPDGKYPVEAGRYHVYVAFNCPWCHRVALTRAMLGLEDAISMDVLFPVRSEEDHPQGANKWQFLPEGLTAKNGRHVSYPSCTVDTVHGFSTIRELYLKYDVDQSSVPILFDKKSMAIVHNESADIIRMMATAFWPLARNKLDLYPAASAAAIDEVNAWVYDAINNGAYRAAFSSNQDAYEAAYMAYFKAFERLNTILASSKFLTGDSVTEADVRLFPTIFRHDPIYYLRMKLNHAMVRQYRHLWRWLCDMCALPGVAGVCPLDQMKQGYYGRTWNNTVPLGPPGYPELLGDRDAYLSESAPPIAP